MSIENNSENINNILTDENINIDNITQNTSIFSLFTTSFKKFLIILLVLITLTIIFNIIDYNTQFFSRLIYKFTPTEYVNVTDRTNYIIKDVTTEYLTPYLDRNKNTLVIFFASWCSHCKDEADSLNSLITNNSDIPVIVVSHDRSKEDLITYLSNHNYNWFAIYDSEKTIRANIDFDSSGIPATYLLNSYGEIITKDSGELTESEFKYIYENQKSKEEE